MFHWSYLAHHTFIPLNPRGLAINKVNPWPFKQVCCPGFGGSEVYWIKAPFFQRVCEQGDLIRGMVNCYCLVYYRLALKLASEFNYEWSVGEEWLTFMQKANDVMLWWQMLDWVEEVQRHLLDTLGWLEFVMRQLVHHLTLVTNFSPPCFMTEGHFIGLES